MLISARPEACSVKAPKQVSPAVLFVADRVRHDVVNAPFLAEALHLPLIRGERVEEVGEIGAFGACQRHHFGAHRSVIPHRCDRYAGKVPYVKVTLCASCTLCVPCTWNVGV